MALQIDNELDDVALNPLAENIFISTSTREYSRRKRYRM